MTGAIAQRNAGGIGDLGLGRYAPRRGGGWRRLDNPIADLTQSRTAGILGLTPGVPPAHCPGSGRSTGRCSRDVDPAVVAPFR
ncbi:MAG: hypothetical protein MZU95_10525 [Desulfomicrobium escambiense]|nr:hypothetical protein [Desulfomicrobium escambiense]